MIVKTVKPEDVETLVQLRDAADAAGQTLDKFSQYIIRSYFEIPDGETIAYADELGNPYYRMSDDLQFVIKLPVRKAR